MKTHRVLLAVRPRLFRESLKSVFCRTPHVEVVDAGSQPLDLLVAVRRWAPDVLVFSQTWPKVPPESMPAACTQLLGVHPALRIIAISARGDRAYACQHRICDQLLPETCLRNVLGEVLNERTLDGSSTCSTSFSLVLPEACRRTTLMSAVSASAHAARKLTPKSLP